MPLEFDVVSRHDHLAARRTEWCALADRSPLTPPFCRPEVWLPWYEAHPALAPAVYELRRGGTAVAVLPMVREGSLLRMAADEYLDYQDFVAGSREDASALMDRILLLEGASASVLSFRKVSEHSLLGAVLEDPSLAEAASIRSRPWSICPTVSFPLSPGRDLLECLPQRHRRNHRNADRRLSEGFPRCRARHWSGASIPPEAIAAAGDLHQANQYRKKGPSIFEQPQFRTFLDSQIADDAPLCLSVLETSEGGSLLAFTLGYFGRDTYHYYLTSYDGRHAEFSPGRWLLVETLRVQAKRVTGGVLRFDLLSGEESYKSRWAKSFYCVARKQVIPKRIDRLPRLAACSAIYGLKGAKNWARSRLLSSPWEKLDHESPGIPR